MFKEEGNVSPARILLIESMMIRIYTRTFRRIWFNNFGIINNNLVYINNVSF